MSCGLLTPHAYKHIQISESKIETKQNKVYNSVTNRNKMETNTYVVN